MAFQAKLNRVIEYDEYTPVGGDPARGLKQFQGRVIAATNRRLAKGDEPGAMRMDLFHRFPQVIDVPPLRARVSDIPLLVDHFLDSASRQRGIQRPTMSAEEIRQLAGYSWPGNIRELKNVIENFVLARRLLAMGGAAASPDREEVADLGSLPYANAKRMAVRRFQQSYIRPILIACNGDLRAAAERMGLSLPGLRKVLGELDGTRADPTDPSVG
jgi:DNA-binding NtrC family response regulator